MKKLLMIVLLLSNLMSIGFANTKKVETYEDLVKKEEKMRDLERENFENDSADTYEADRKKEEERREEDSVFEDEATGPDMTKYIEVKDDAGYDENNMDKVREAGHRAWDKEQKEFDKGNK